MFTSSPTSALGRDIMLIFLPWPLPDTWISRIKSKHPGIEVRWANPMGPGGRFMKPEDFDNDIWKDVTLISPFIFTPPAKLLSSVRFVQLPSAGLERWLDHPIYADKNVYFCTANGVHAPQISEWVFGAYLMHQHHFLHYANLMKDGIWEPPMTSTVQDCPSARIGVLGYGAIGRQCARIASIMGMDVYAYTRSEKSTAEERKDDSYCVPGTGDPDGLVPTKWFHGSTQKDINHFLGQDLDLLVLSLPLTTETRGLLSYEQFDILSKKKTFVANIARGGHINQEALIEALESGKIRGAALDVADPEPLPSDHPLWKAPNLLITPHVSWQTNQLMPRILDVLEINLDHLSSGRPLINQVNRELHY